MALYSQPYCYVKTVTTVNCSLVPYVQAKAAPNRSSVANRLSATLKDFNAAKAICMPVTIWVNAVTVAPKSCLCRSSEQLARVAVR